MNLRMSLHRRNTTQVHVHRPDRQRPTHTRHAVLAVVLFSLLTVSCSPLRIADLVTPRDGYKLHADLAYGAADRQRLDVYVPGRAAAPLAVVVFFYGGRWQGGNKRDYRFVAQALADRGFLVVVPDYRLFPNVVFPTFIEDGARAVAWIHRHIDTYGGDRKQIFLAGHSAGAHIAAMLSFDERYLTGAGVPAASIQGFLGLAGPYDFLPMESADLLQIFGPVEHHGATQPINFVDGSEPPALLLHGLKDESVLPRNSRRFASAIQARGGRVDARYFAHGNHFTIIAAFIRPLQSQSSLLEDIETFIRNRLSEVES